MKRNKLIVDAADVVVCFWDLYSHGTRDSRDYAIKQGKEVLVYSLNGDLVEVHNVSPAP
jgi:predicted Rossmann fold nucleotide-binding protein DprA/Smf involved in DNA uptake